MRLLDQRNRVVDGLQGHLSEFVLVSCSSNLEYQALPHASLLPDGGHIFCPLVDVRPSSLGMPVAIS